MSPKYIYINGWEIHFFLSRIRTHTHTHTQARSKIMFSDHLGPLSCSHTDVNKCVGGADRCLVLWFYFWHENRDAGKRPMLHHSHMYTKFGSHVVPYHIQFERWWYEKVMAMMTILFVYEKFVRIFLFSNCSGRTTCDIHTRSLIAQINAKRSALRCSLTNFDPQSIHKCLSFRRIFVCWMLFQACLRRFNYHIRQKAEEN